MAAYYVFVRCWPGFTEPFPFEQFNSLTEEELGPALEAFAREQLRAHGVRAQIKQRVKQRRRNRVSALVKQSKRLLGPSPQPKSGRRVDIREIRRMIGLPDRKLPLVCQLGDYLGWYRPWTTGDVGDWPSRVWFWKTLSREFAKQLVAELGCRPNLDFHEHQAEFYFNPRPGFISDEGMSNGERAAIGRFMNKIQAGQEPPVNRAKLAKLIGYRAFQVARELAEAWPADALPELAEVPAVEDTGPQEATGGREPSPEEAGEDSQPKTKPEATDGQEGKSSEETAKQEPSLEQATETGQGGDYSKAFETSNDQGGGPGQEDNGSLEKAIADLPPLERECLEALKHFGKPINTSLVQKLKDLSATQEFYLVCVFWNEARKLSPAKLRKRFVATFDTKEYALPDKKSGTERVRKGIGRGRKILGEF